MKANERRAEMRDQYSLDCMSADQITLTVHEVAIDSWIQVSGYTCSYISVLLFCSAETCINNFQLNWVKCLIHFRVQMTNFHFNVKLNVKIYLRWSWNGLNTGSFCRVWVTGIITWTGRNDFSLIPCRKSLRKQIISIWKKKNSQMGFTLKCLHYPAYCQKPALLQVCASREKKVFALTMPKDFKSASRNSQMHKSHF